jgi:hypothetical protein
LATLILLFDVVHHPIVDKVSSLLKIISVHLDRQLVRLPWVYRDENLHMPAFVAVRALHFNQKLVHWLLLLGCEDAKLYPVEVVSKGKARIANPHLAFGAQGGARAPLPCSLRQSEHVLCHRLRLSAK